MDTVRAAHALAHALVIARADILADKRAHCRADGLSQLPAEELNLCCNAIGHNQRRGIGVDLGLQGHIGDGDDAHLQARGNAEHEDLLGNVQIHAQLALLQAQHRQDLKGICQAQRAGNRLRKHRRQRSARHAHRDHSNKQDIQRNVEHAGDDQRHQRHHRIAQRAHDSRDPVIEHRARTAREDDGQVLIGIIHQRIRRLQKTQQPLRAQHAQHGNERRRNQRNKNRAGKRLANLLFVARAVVLRNDDAHARGQAHHQRHQQIHRRARDAHRGQGLVPQISSDNEHIHKVIDALEQHAQQHRRAEFHQLRHDRSAGHVHDVFLHRRLLRPGRS